MSSYDEYIDQELDHHNRENGYGCEASEELKWHEEEEARRGCASCQHCGALNVTNARRCDSCGARLQ
jgi:ribosomal protein L40E